MDETKHSSRTVSPSIPYWILRLSILGGPFSKMKASAET